MKNSSYEVKVIKVSEGNFINNCYLIVDKTTRYAALVDPAWEIEKIERCIGNAGARLKTILLTHSHYDHINLVNKLIECYPDVTVVIGQEEVEYYDYHCCNMQIVQEGSRLSLGMTTITPIHTPGHTFGSYCYKLTLDIFTGDTLFLEGVGICSVKGSDCRDLYYSIAKLKMCLQENCMIYPGHTFYNNPGMTFKEVKKLNIYLHFDNELAFIEFRNRGNQSSNVRFI